MANRIGIESIVLALLPLIAFLCICIAAGNIFPGWGWRRAFVRSFVGVGGYTILANEGLSLIRGITIAGLAIVWILPILAAGIWGVRRRLRGTPVRVPAWGNDLTLTEWILVVGVGAIVVITAVVAWIAPPNTWDSLTYHMSRVAHWAQEGSLRPYATGIERQIFMSPVAEIGMLQVYVLGSGDRLVNFVEWFAMLVSIVAVTLLAKDLGAGRLGQLFSAVFVSTLPMGIAQASSTMTDYVVAVWAVDVACESVLIAQGARGRAPVISACLAAGLTIGSKPTGFAYLLPLAVFIGASLVRRRGLREAAVWTIVAVGVVGILNAGYLSRNMAVYGNLLGRERTVSQHSNKILDWRVVISNTLRNASLHAGTPDDRINDWIYLSLAKVHFKLGLDLTEPRTSTHSEFRITRPSMSETRAGNPLHALLIIVSFVLAIVFWRKVGPIAAVYSIVIALSFVVLSTMFKFTIYGSRYHMGFFVLYAPLAGYVIWRVFPRSLVALIGLGLILASRQWVFGIDQRPLVPMSRRASPSILETSRREMYLIGGPLQAYETMTDAILGARCSTVGVMISGNSAEYVLWVMLGAPRSDLEIEWIVGGTPSARYEDPAFEPCAVICDISCEQALVTVRGLPLISDASGYRLFMQPPKTTAP